MEPGKTVMERRPLRRSRGRGGARLASGLVPASRPAELRGAKLWLFPSADPLRSALSRRTEATRQMCCTRERLAVLERGGAGVEVHQLPAGSDGARKPSEWGGAAPLGPPAAGWGCECGGLPGSAPAGSESGSGPAGTLLCRVARLVGVQSFSHREGHSEGDPTPQRSAEAADALRPGGFSRLARAASLSSPRPEPGGRGVWRGGGEE